MSASIIVSFFAGLLTDVIRSVLLPASTDWLRKKFSFGKREANRQENLMQLEVIARLDSLGLDPLLAQHIDADSNEFLRQIGYQRGEFRADTENDDISDDDYLTQSDMNIEAMRRASDAVDKLQKLVDEIARSELLSESSVDELGQAQRQWESFQSLQAEFEGYQFAGGSLRPTIYWSAHERLTLDRMAYLRALHHNLVR